MTEQAEFIHGVFSCDRCGQILLIVTDAADLGLPGEMAAKVDGHRCPPPTEPEPVREIVRPCIDPRAEHPHWCGGCGQKFMFRLLSFEGTCAETLASSPCPDCRAKDWRNQPPIPAEHLPAVHVARGMVDKITDLTKKWTRP